MVNSCLPIETIRESFEYSNGKLYWKTRPEYHFATKRGCSVFNTRYAGCRAGSKLAPQNTYHIIWITILGVKYQALEHVIVWALLNGEFPKSNIDHKDGDGLNNKIENLRLVTHIENMQNKARYKNNNSGLAGVSWYKSRDIWIVQGTYDGKKKTIGYAADLFEAACLRKKWELSYNFTDRHGR